MGATPAVAVTMVAGARTAVRPVDGELAGWNPVALAGVVGREVLERAGLDAGVLDEVVVGCCDPVGAAGADVARAIVLAAGWPVSIGGSVIDRGETSGAAAVQAAVAAIRAGQARTVLVVGLGLCSVVPPGAAALNRTYGAPWGGVAERFEEVGGLLPAPRLSERAAQAAGIGRTELDAAAEESRRRRAAAGSTGSATGSTEGSGSTGGSAAESNSKSAAAGSGSRSAASPAIVAVAARPGDAAGRGVYRGDPVATDGLRDWGDAAELPPAFDDDGLLTAATFAPPADCVAAVLLQAGEAQAPDGVAGTGRAARDSSHSVGNVTAAVGQASSGEATVAGTGRAADDPSDSVGNVAAAVGRAPGGVATVAGMGRAAGDPFDPVGNVAVAVDRALGDAGIELATVDGISVVEHDAATTMLVAQALDIDAELINRDGGAVATGDAGAAEELRLITDGLAVTGGQGLLLTISAGPTGSAAIVWQTDI